MTREEAKRVIGEPRAIHFGLTPIPLEDAARLKEAQLVLSGWAPDDIYEALTDFLMRRPDAPPDDP